VAQVSNSITGQYLKCVLDRDDLSLGVA
jgi:hypothetical protein